MVGLWVQLVTRERMKPTVDAVQKNETYSRFVLINFLKEIQPFGKKTIGNQITKNIYNTIPYRGLY